MHNAIVSDKPHSVVMLMMIIMNDK